MVHHSIAVVITSFLTNFSERRAYELRGIPLPRTWVNKGIKKGRGTTPRPSTSFARCPASSLAYLTHGSRHRTRASVEAIEAAVVTDLSPS
jgi:hypothetical protein